MEPARWAPLLGALLLAGRCSPGAAASLGERNVGCLFSENLCDDMVEMCYDDNAFGRCVEKDSLDDQNFYQHELDRAGLRLLEKEMWRLFALGYRWSHSYTQCVLQLLLDSLRYRKDTDTDLCEPLIDQDLEAAVKAIKGDEEEQLDPSSVAIVKFTPSDSDPHAVYADEVYFPPDSDEEAARRSELNERASAAAVERVEEGEGEPEPEPEEFLPSVSKKQGDPHGRRALPMDAESLLLGPLRAEQQVFSRRYNTPDGFRSGSETRDKALPRSFSQLYEPSDLFLPAREDQREEPEEGEEDPREDAELASRGLLSGVYNTPEGFRSGAETRDKASSSHNYKALVATGGGNSDGGFSRDYDTPEGFRRDYDTPEGFRRGYDSPEGYRRDYDTPEGFSRDYNRPKGFRRDYDTPEGFSRDYNTPEGFRRGHESRDGREEENEIPRPPRARLPDKQYKPLENPSSGLLQLANIFYGRERPSEDGAGASGAAYTEGGLVFLPGHSGELKDGDQRRSPAALQRALDDDLDELLDEYDPLDGGFKRKERLDVKKPGPLFSTNNYAFRHQAGQEEEDEQDKNERRSQLDDLRPEAYKPSTGYGWPKMSSYLAQHGKNSSPHVTPEKKEVVFSAGVPTSTALRYDVVDTTYTYITFKDSIYEWKKGNEIAERITNLLSLPRSTFTNIQLGEDKHDLIFKVRANPRHMNASEVARKIIDIKDQLKEKEGVEVVSAGIGNKTKFPLVETAQSDPLHRLLVVSLFAGGTFSALLVGAAAICLARRLAASRRKLRGLSAPETEASKDYQDLCRARMATKAQNEKPEPLHMGQRIASLSRESEGSNNSPSSRSSTSSWSEEPALTNMDISTGHMVLSYMEDHLKNKFRLEQEWEGLCAYEAEPCAVTVAQREENIKKNRYPDILPYDHARVVLNDLTNISGSDYINASTITDHDPRNPAYIATQGPLPHTAPDFWQMVWEQGSVVMVMLTRLTENGSAMCHRYWPEEGSELYHIYEVHLVSEHIWCDDYLVRSFYLKNLKTGETRTVTQFHFLSWPEGGIPLSTKALLEFRRKVNKSYRGRSCPIVVHCSDGAGRTGTYCLVDMVLNRMAKGAKEIDIAATLEHIRDQRAAAVRTRQQFEFVLTAVAEEVNAILKALPPLQKQQQQQQQQEAAAPKQQQQQEAAASKQQ
ncbi:receptor-type tyrosine-protein phosphatase N2 [Bacillus rossius redtenbacheri]|uniref:receptor-type tyrosine-protein phosphatase N2 n=1 Tax=Bacillus rossius redtenbacheri TaxID=93214 RepID=UPI002FDD9553